MCECVRFSCRTQIIVAILLLPANSLVGGCALNQTGTQEVVAAIDRNRTDRDDTGNLYAETPGLVEPPVESRPAPPLPGTLREFIVYALKHNPEIQSAEETAAALAERIPQVTALPDPTLYTKTFPEPIRTAEGDNYFILGAQQRFPVPEKLDRAGRIALEETRMAIERLQQTRLQVIADVKRAYFQLYIIDKSLEITQNNQDLLRGLIEVARGQVAAGRRSQEDVLRALVELSNLEAELIELRQRRVSVVAAMNRLLNRSPIAEVPSTPDFDIRDAELERKKLFDLAIKTNPELRRLKQQIERDRHAVRLAQLAYWPDFVIGFEWIQMDPRDAFRPPPNPMTGQRPTVPQMSEDGSDNWAITFGLNLPIWYQKINAGIREGRRKLAASIRDHISASNMIYFRVADALARMDAQKELAEIFESTIIPQAQQAYEVSRAEYSAGEGDFLFVIDNWRKWLVFAIQYHRALGELERSVADLEQAIGLSLSEPGISP